jgi:hypothetical protein
MITAGLAPACPAAVHRLLAVVIERRATEPLSWSPLAITVALAVPLALLTLAAIWCWRSRRPFFSAALLLGMYALQPPAVLPLAALYPLGATSPSRWMSPASAALLLAAGAAVLFVLGPDCAGAQRPGLVSIAGDALLVFGHAVGVLLALLALFEVLTAPRSPEVRLAGAIIGLGLAAVFLSPTFDRRLTLVPSVVACWWLAGRAALRLIRDSTRLAARAVTIVVLVTIPALIAAGVARTAPPRAVRMTWSELSSTLARIPRPGALVTTDAALSPWIAAWRAGLSDGANSLTVVSPESTSFVHALQTHGVFAFESEVERLSQTGVVWGLVEPGHGSPRLYRAVDYLPCVALRRSWSDVTSLAEMDQLTIRNSNANVRTATVVYAAQPGPLTPGTAVSLRDAGPTALRGTRLREFDLTRDDGRQQFAAAAAADGLDTSGWVGAGGLVSRVVIDHEPAWPALSTLILATPPLRVAARAELPPRWPYSLSMCRSATPRPVVGYAGAPDAVPLNLRADDWSGRGWHASEAEGGVVFRWTGEPRAEVRVFVARPASYRLTLGLMPIAGNVREQLVIAANGRRLARDSGPDAWLLPSDALRRGINTLTLEAPVVPAPPPDTRRLGLKVRSIVLHRLPVE